MHKIGAGVYMNALASLLFIRLYAFSVISVMSGNQIPRQTTNGLHYPDRYARTAQVTTSEHQEN